MWKESGRNKKQRVKNTDMECSENQVDTDESIVGKSLQQSPALTTHLDVTEMTVSYNEWEHWSNLYTDLLNIMWIVHQYITVLIYVDINSYLLLYITSSDLFLSFTLKDTKWKLSAFCVLFKYKSQH